MTKAAAIMDATGGTSVASSAEGWHSEAVKLITEFTQQSGDWVSDSWRKFLPTLFETYRDGQIVTTNLTYIIRKSMFYPDWWLTLVGYWNIGGNPTGIYFDADPFSHSLLDGERTKNAHNDGNNSFANAEDAGWTPTLFFGIAVAFLGFGAGRYSGIKEKRKDYIPL